jgi:hypothetical protein
MIRWSATTAVVLATLGASAAQAAPALITTRPVVEDADQLGFFVGGVDDTGRSLKASTVDVSAEGASLGPPASTQALSDWAAVASESNPTWRPPLAVGLVYLWAEGVPPTVLDAIHAFFQRIPTRTTVYPTLYGRMRQGRARLTAGEIGRLDEIPYLDGHRPNAIDAIALDLTDLAADAAPIKILLVVTDGRDYADPRGEGPGDFLRLGAAIRKAGVTPFVVKYAPPQADAETAAANLRDLHEAAGGFLRSLDQNEDLENTLESLGQGVADLLHVQVAAPWSWRTLGGSHRLSARITLGNGQRLSAELGTATFPGSLMLWGILAAAATAIVAGVLLVRQLRAPAGPPVQEVSDELFAVHDLIRRGVSPQRAVDELTRNHPEAIQALADADGDVLDDPRFPYFRTRAGRLRLQEIRALVAKKKSTRPAFGRTLIDSLVSAVEGRTTPEDTAAKLSVRVAEQEWTSFAGLDLQQLSAVLRDAAKEFPILGTPRARGLAVSIQDQLRGRGGLEPILVGWLVRSEGPGRRGQTLRLSDERNVLGSAPGCNIRLTEDPSIADEHAEIARQGSEFSISALRGAVQVEGSAIDGRRALTDGETIEIGTTFLVFKSASAGTLISSASREEEDD